MRYLAGLGTKAGSSCGAISLHNAAKDITRRNEADEKLCSQALFLDASCPFFSSELIHDFFGTLNVDVMLLGDLRFAPISGYGISLLRFLFLVLD